MRIAIMMFLLLVPFVAVLSAQSGSDDPYGMDLVAFELKMNSEGRRVTHGFSQKRLIELGDRVSIALLKILNPPDLKDPEKVKGFLPIIRDSFAFPEAISVESDKRPRITLFLLDYLRKNLSDAQAQRFIQETIDFVKQKTTE